MDSFQQKQAIDELLASLDPWALLYARSKLRDVVFKFAGLEDLPPEIICMVVPFLGWKDYFTVGHVSKTWSRAWSHQAVLIAFCQHLFPGLYQMNKHSTQPKQLKQLLEHAMWNRLKWRQRELNMEIIPWIPSWSSPQFTNESRPALQQLEDSTGTPTTVENIFPMKYCEGLIAWQNGYDLAIIDDLRARTRRRCALDSGRLSGKRLEIKGLSRRLLVFSGLGSNELIANTM